MVHACLETLAVYVLSGIYDVMAGLSFISRHNVDLLGPFVVSFCAVVTLMAFFPQALTMYAITGYACKAYHCAARSQSLQSRDVVEAIIFICLPNYSAFLAWRDWGVSAQRIILKHVSKKEKHGT